MKTGGGGRSVAWRYPIQNILLTLLFSAGTAAYGNNKSCFGGFKKAEAIKKQQAWLECWVLCWDIRERRKKQWYNTIEIVCEAMSDAQPLPKGAASYQSAENTQTAVVALPIKDYLIYSEDYHRLRARQTIADDQTVYHKHKNKVLCRLLSSSVELSWRLLY